MNGSLSIIKQLRISRFLDLLLHLQSKTRFNLKLFEEKQDFIKDYSNTVATYKKEFLANFFTRIFLIVNNVKEIFK